MSQNSTPKKTAFRKYTAAAMAAFTIGASLYGFLFGVFDGAVEGGLAGTIVGFAAKYLWEETGQ